MLVDETAPNTAVWVTGGEGPKRGLQTEVPAVDLPALPTGKRLWSCPHASFPRLPLEQANFPI